MMYVIIQYMAPTITQGSVYYACSQLEALEISFLLELASFSLTAQILAVCMHRHNLKNVRFLASMAKIETA